MSASHAGSVFSGVINRLGSPEQALRWGRLLLHNKGALVSKASWFTEETSTECVQWLQQIIA
eukprot:854611-Prorocentrum_minimum.AAC.1